MVYMSYEDMANCIRRNVWKVPKDVDLIVGIPRSGMIPALMIAELLNVRCATLDEFLYGMNMSCGGRGRLIRMGDVRRVLVLDDTVFLGNALRRVRKQVDEFVVRNEISVIYGCVYAEGKYAKEMVSIYFEENYRPGEAWYFYEWNILHHYGKRTRAMMWDIDGLVCKDPPDDRDIESYEAYLPNAIPMIIPRTTIGAFVTYRMEKYRGVTEEWLRKQGIEYEHLLMHPADTRAQRKHDGSPAEYKAKIYREAQWAVLFVESSMHQAERIHQLSGKPVWCYENGRMYV